MKYLLTYLLPFVLLFTFMPACSSSDSARDRDQGLRTERPTQDFTNYRDLADYLRRVASVRVTGSGNNVNIQIRGTSSFESETRPLYVIDGRIMGNSYYEVNRMLDMSEVSDIRVLTDGDAAGYGARGANGVIEITLK